MLPGDPSVTSTWCNHGPAAVPGEPGVNRVSEKWYRVSQVWPGSYRVSEG
jgi:hypothetical protein